MDGLIDLHAHILPDLDDGPDTAEEAVVMARKAVESGTVQLVATPHSFDGMFMNTKEEVQEAVRILEEELQREGIPLTILPGMEYRVHPDLLSALHRDELQTVNGSRYILIELPYSQIPLYTESVLRSLLAEGLVPVIVHPERTRPFRDNLDLLADLVDWGMLAILSVDALDSRAGHEMHKAVQGMLIRHLVHGVASDAHNSTRRAPVLAGSWEALTERMGLRECPGWMRELPGRMIRNENIEVPEPIFSKEKRFWWQRR